MKILFWGGTQGNNGPANINKGIVENLTVSFHSVRVRNKYLEMVEALWKLLFSDAVVVSGVSRKGSILVRFARLLGKKSVYLMHGCAEYEMRLNGQKGMNKGLEQERHLLENADLLLPVSEKFMHWFQERYPQFADKTEYLYNGMDADSLRALQPKEKVPGSIVATGADRRVKNNAVVAQVIEHMGGKANLEVYGWIYHGAPEGFRYTKYMGAIPHKKYIEKLEETELFVLNSVFESFSISAIEALMCGCSVLLSEIAGVTGILELEETDIIHDPMDAEEIRSKIVYLLEHPNNERILSKLDQDEWTFAKMVERLEEKCRKLLDA